jgi:uncharacterized membrane-anchored protein YhcB (DUF1043 family)
MEIDVWGKNDEPAAPVQAQAEPDKQREQWLRWGIPALALVIGVIAGGAITETDVEASPAYLTLQSELTSSRQEADELANDVEDATAAIRRATEEGEARLAQRAAELDGRSAQLDQREQELVAREASAPQVPSVTQPAPAAAEPAIPAPPAPEPPASSSTYYENCDAVRAAGAAPIRTGDPGYAGHLDRDGDGVACE